MWSQCQCGKMGFLGKGFDLEIGDNSGIGIRCVVLHDIVIGENVLMGSHVYIFGGSTRVFRM